MPSPGRQQHRKSYPASTNQPQNSSVALDTISSTQTKNKSSSRSPLKGREGKGAAQFSANVLRAACGHQGEERTLVSRDSYRQQHGRPSRCPRLPRFSPSVPSLPPREETRDRRKKARHSPAKRTKPARPCLPRRRTASTGEDDRPPPQQPQPLVVSLTILAYYFSPSVSQNLTLTDPVVFQGLRVQRTFACERCSPKNPRPTLLLLRADHQNQQQPASGVPCTPSRPLQHAFHTEAKRKGASHSAQRLFSKIDLKTRHDRSGATLDPPTRTHPLLFGTAAV